MNCRCHNLDTHQPRLLLTPNRPNILSTRKATIAQLLHRCCNLHATYMRFGSQSAGVAHGREVERQSISAVIAFTLVTKAVWLQLQIGFDLSAILDCNAIISLYDHSKTFVTTVGTAAGMNKLCWRPPQYAPAPCKLTFDLLTLKVVSESRVTWVTSVRILVFLGLSALHLGPMYATDRRQ